MAMVGWAEVGVVEEWREGVGRGEGDRQYHRQHQSAGAADDGGGAAGSSRKQSVCCRDVL